MMEAVTLSAPPLLLSASDAARLLGIGERHFHALNSTGRVPLPVELGRRRLWRRRELENWVDAGCPAREEWVNRNQNSIDRPA